MRISRIPGSKLYTSCKAHSTSSPPQYLLHQRPAKAEHIEQTLNGKLLKHVFVPRLGIAADRIATLSGACICDRERISDSEYIGRGCYRNGHVPPGCALHAPGCSPPLPLLPCHTQTLSALHAAHLTALGSPSALHGAVCIMPHPHAAFLKHVLSPSA